MQFLQWTISNKCQERDRFSSSMGEMLPRSQSSSSLQKPLSPVTVTIPIQREMKEWDTYEKDLPAFLHSWDTPERHSRKEPNNGTRVPFSKGSGMSAREFVHDLPLWFLVKCGIIGSAPNLESSEISTLEACNHFS